jgi:hypothetical protein
MIQMHCNGVFLTLFAGITDMRNGLNGLAAKGADDLKR